MMDEIEIRATLLHGRCHLFALAMHKTTGLPIGAYLDQDLEIEQTVLVHAFVFDGDMGIDARGKMPIGQLLDNEFDTLDPEFCAISIEELFLLAEAAPIPDLNCPAYRIAEAEAKRLAEQIGVDVVPSETIRKEQFLRETRTDGRGGLSARAQALPALVQVGWVARLGQTVPETNPFHVENPVVTSRLCKTSSAWIQASDSPSRQRLPFRLRMALT